MILHVYVNNMNISTQFYNENTLKIDWMKWFFSKIDIPLYFLLTKSCFIVKLFLFY